MASSCTDPLNLGRSELVTINGLLTMVEEIAGVKVKRNYNLDAPQGVRGRNSDNAMIKEKLGWEPEVNLRTGMEKTYHWIKEQFDRRKAENSTSRAVGQRPPRAMLVSSMMVW